MNQNVFVYLSMINHANDDWKEGTGEGSNEELFTALETGVFTGVETNNGDRDGEQPEPLPYQRLGDKQFFHLQHKYIQSVKNFWSQFCNHHKEKNVMCENCPFQSIFILCTEKLNSFYFCAVLTFYLHLAFCQNSIICI